MESARPRGFLSRLLARDVRARVNSAGKLRTLWHYLLLPALTAALGSFSTNAAGMADLSLSVSMPSSERVNLSYFVTVSNAGPSMATGVVISSPVPTNVLFISATGGAAPTDGVLLVELGSLAVGATNSIQIAERCTDADPTPQPVGVESVFRVSADQTDPEPTNNSVDTIVRRNTTCYTTSTVTREATVTATVNQRTNEYSTELVAKLANGTVVYDQAFDAAYSDATVQSAVAKAAAALAEAGASSYTGPTPSSPLSETLEGNSSVTVTNVIGTDVSFATAMYVGPQTIRVGDLQARSFFLAAGQVLFDTLVTSTVTNLVVTTNTATYLSSAAYVMTGVWGPEFRITSVRLIGFGQIELRWGCPTNGLYTIEKSTNLAASSFVPIATVDARAGQNTNTDAIGSAPRAFYRVAQTR